MAIHDEQGRPYMNPYLAGVGIGLVLLAAYVVMGRGLGASGAFTSILSAGVAGVAPEHARANGLWAHYLAGGSPLRDWLVFEILGVTVGGLLSAAVAGRFRIATERGPGIDDHRRLYLAFGGGAIMGLGAKLARGCTSGQALTGGALLSVGSWLFILGAFAAAYLAAPLFRRQWL
ncbi:MAG: YeeE/YedE thiosulfate transporter family protein [Gemmatimonadota bacterium]